MRREKKEWKQICQINMNKWWCTEIPWLPLLGRYRCSVGTSGACCNRVCCYRLCVSLQRLFLKAECVISGCVVANRVCCYGWTCTLTHTHRHTNAHTPWDISGDNTIDALQALNCPLSCSFFVSLSLSFLHTPSSVLVWWGGVSVRGYPKAVRGTCRRYVSRRQREEAHRVLSI